MLRGSALVLAIALTLTACGPSPADNGRSPAPAATPTASPTTRQASPATTPTVSLSNGALEAGTTYVADQFAIPFSFTANEGWTAILGDQAETAFSLLSSQAKVTLAHPDELYLRGPIDACTGCPDDLVSEPRSISAPATVAEWLASFEEIVAFTLGDATAVSVDGAEGVQLPIDVLDVSGSHSAGGERGTGVFTAGGRVWGLPRGDSRIYLFETRDGVVWVSVEPGRGTIDDAMAQAQPLLDSLAFD